MPKADVSLSRSVAIQLYLKEGIADEDLLLRVWQMAGRKGKARGQNLFRMMLSAGLLALTENGQMPEEIVEALNLDMLVDKKIRRRRRIEEARNPQAVTPAHSPAYGYPAPYPLPYASPVYPSQPFYPQSGHAPIQPQEREYEAPERVADAERRKSKEYNAAPDRAIDRAPVTSNTASQVKSDGVAADRTPVNNGTVDEKNSNEKSYLDLM